MKFGTDDVKIPVEMSKDMMAAAHRQFPGLRAEREKPHLDVETAAARR